MMAAFLKLYFIGTALTVLAVIYRIVDSVGGLMHVQKPDYRLVHHTTGELWSEQSQQRRPFVAKGVGS